MTVPEDSLLEKLRQRSRAQLLQMRAEGDDLPDQWHAAIETIFTERGEPLPPKPMQPIEIVQLQRPEKGAALIACGGILLALFVGKFLQHSMIGLAVALGVLLFYLAKFIRRVSLPETQRLQEIAAARAAKMGMNELMRCAADGDLQRVNELLAYGAMDINARSATGATALVYAARNGHMDILEFLIQHGARRDLLTHKGSSAKSIALQFGHTSIAEKLELLA